VVGKPGWNVSWEEAGYAWYEIEIAGQPGYAGSRHKVPHRNPLLPAAELVGQLERWIAGYTARNAHGVVSASHGGTSQALANTPGWCRVYVDLRHSPRMTPADTDAELGAFLDGVAAGLDGFELTWRRVAQVEAHEGPGRGSLFDAAVRAWEGLEGSAHEVVEDNSGASEANLLRAAGIETVKVGLPKVAAPGLISDFHMGMDSADPRAMALYTQLLLEVIGRICAPATAGVAA
jgi:acetylornithine deacetylase/succinyl-diaminopimelate desuccinylase-like protein